MMHLIEAVESSLRSKNWYAALFLALTLPDICGRLENPNEKSSKRYEKWFEKYIKDKYVSRDPIRPRIGEHVFLSASDCYALRCACLHEGRDDVSLQRAREVLERFLFIEPGEKGAPHCCQVNSMLQLRVDKFCADICAGIRKWLEDNAQNSDVQDRLKELMIIHQPGVSVGRVRFGD